MDEVPEVPEALDVDRQAAWEVAAVARAVAKYRATAGDRDPAELPPGRRVLVETVGPVSAVIETHLEAATAATGRPEAWHAPMLLFDADVLALVAVSAALRAAPLAQSRVGSTLPVFSRRVCAVLRDQADHDRWMRETRKAADKDPEARAALGRWRRLFPDGSRRAWGRFAAKLEGARTNPWDERTRVAVGGVLAAALARGAPKWFELVRVGEDPREDWRPLSVVLTPHAVERMADVEARSEVSRPLLLPMLIPPNPWRYVEANNREIAA